MNPDDPGLRALRIERLLRIAAASSEPVALVMLPEPMLIPAHLVSNVEKVLRDTVG